MPRPEYPTTSQKLRPERWPALRRLSPRGALISGRSSTHLTANLNVGRRNGFGDLVQLALKRGKAQRREQEPVRDLGYDCDGFACRLCLNNAKEVDGADQKLYLGSRHRE